MARGADRHEGAAIMGVPVLPDAPIVLAASVTDWIERGTPVVLFAFALVLVALRRRERRRGPDEDAEDPGPPRPPG